VHPAALVPLACVVFMVPMTSNGGSKLTYKKHLQEAKLHGVVTGSVTLLQLQSLATTMFLCVIKITCLTGTSFR